MARLRATASAARSVLDRREHDGTLGGIGKPITPAPRTIKKLPHNTIKKPAHAYEQQERYQRSKEEERLKLEQRFISGADCGWTPIGTSHAFYCRRNGRAFRITQGKDNRWTLYRVKDSSDKGKMLGTYQGRRDASAALKTIAYAPEPRE
jgi:hypothetical protein